MNQKWKEGVRAAARVVCDAQALLVCAGAGMGVDSGLPDFRGSEGFWNAYPPYKKLGLDFYDLAAPEWFVADPALAWGFYGHRLNLYRQTAPHAGFARLLEWASAKPGEYFVFTSNVDGQFQKAGFAKERIHECHGSLQHLQCAAGCWQDIWPAAAAAVRVDEKTMRAEPPLPLCPKCGRPARPNVLMFGDWNWLPQRSREQGRRLQRWLDSIGGGRLAIIECGAGTAVPSVRNLSEGLLGRPGTELVRINTRQAQVPAGQVGLPGSALAMLEAIAALISGN